MTDDNSVIFPIKGRHKVLTILGVLSLFFFPGMVALFFVLGTLWYYFLPLTAFVFFLILKQVFFAPNACIVTDEHIIVQYFFRAKAISFNEIERAFELVTSQAGRLNSFASIELQGGKKLYFLVENYLDMIQTINSAIGYSPPSN